jgi:hypothetical protein
MGGEGGEGGEGGKCGECGEGGEGGGGGGGGEGGEGGEGVGVGGDMGGGGATTIGTTAWPTVMLATAVTVTPRAAEINMRGCATNAATVASTVAAVAAAVSAVAEAEVLMLVLADGAAWLGMVRRAAMATLAAETRSASRQAGAWQPTRCCREVRKAACCDGPKSLTVPATINPISMTVAGVSMMLSPAPSGKTGSAVGGGVGGGGAGVVGGEGEGGSGEG